MLGPARVRMIDEDSGVGQASMNCAWDEADSFEKVQSPTVRRFAVHGRVTIAGRCHPLYDERYAAANSGTLRHRDKPKVNGRDRFVLACNEASIRMGRIEPAVKKGVMPVFGERQVADETCVPSVRFSARVGGYESHHRIRIVGIYAFYYVKRRTIINA